MVFHGPRLVFHGFRLVLMVFHGPRLVFHGSRLVFHVFVMAPGLVFILTRVVFNQQCQEISVATQPTRPKYTYAS